MILPWAKIDAKTAALRKCLQESKRNVVQIYIPSF